MFGGIDQLLPRCGRQSARAADEAIYLIQARAQLVKSCLREASIQARDRRCEFVNKAARLVHAQHAFRDQSSNVAHQELTGILRSTGGGVAWSHPLSPQQASEPSVLSARTLRVVGLVRRTAD